MMMEAYIQGMPLKMVIDKESEYSYGQMVIRKQESGIRINYMVLPRLHMKMVQHIGDNTRIIRRKDMEHLSILVETYTLGSGCRVACTGMEYLDGQMERYIKDNANKIKEKAMDIPGGQAVMSIMDNTKMISSMER